MDLKWILIGLALLGLSAVVSAAYNPYINNNPYVRPYYSQFHSPLGVNRVISGYYSAAYSPAYSGYTIDYMPSYNPYYYYRSPALVSYPTVTVYNPPVRVRSYGVNFVYYN